MLISISNISVIVCLCNYAPIQIFTYSVRSVHVYVHVHMDASISW